MHWVYEEVKKNSAYNGTIVARRVLGSWEVHVGDSIQTSDYTNAMWADACRRVHARGMPVNNILMLGLGGGGAIKPLHEMFSNCKIKVVEIDPAMVEVAKAICLYKPHQFPPTMVGDATKIAPALAEQFDLILVDLFCEREPEADLNGDEFLQALKERLAAGGTMVVNASGKQEYLAAARRTFPTNTVYMFRRNHLGLFLKE